MDPGNIPFNTLIVGPTNSGKTQFLVNQLCGPFNGKFNYIVLICPTFAYNRTQKKKPQHMTLQKFYAKNKFGLLIDLRSMESQKMHGSGTRIVNSTDGAQLEIERDGKGSGQVNCHVYIISDSQFNIFNKQLQSVQY